MRECSFLHLCKSFQDRLWRWNIQWMLSNLVSYIKNFNRFFLLIQDTITYFLCNIQSLTYLLLIQDTITYFLCNIQSLTAAWRFYWICTSRSNWKIRASIYFEVTPPKTNRNNKLTHSITEWVFRTNRYITSKIILTHQAFYVVILHCEYPWMPNIHGY